MHAIHDPHDDDDDEPVDPSASPPFFGSVVVGAVPPSCAMPATAGEITVVGLASVSDMYRDCRQKARALIYVGVFLLLLLHS